MRGSSLALASIVVVAGAARADAGVIDWFVDLFQSKPKPVMRRATFTITYSVDPDDDGEINGRFAARGIRVGAYTHENLFGAASIDAAAETDANGRVSFVYPVRPGEKVTFRFETDGRNASTYPGKSNFWETPHRGKLELSVADSQKDVKRALFWTGRMNDAIGVQAAATHARAYGERILGSDYRDKVDYEFPCTDPKGEDKDISHTSSPSHVSVAEPAWGRAHHTIFHETGHTFYLKARGRLRELLRKIFDHSSKSAHSFTTRMGDPRRALSEGMANFFMVFAKDEFGRLRGRSDLVTAQSLGWCGEYHAGRDHPDVEFVVWGNDTEVNVGNGLHDLVDLEEDDLGIVAGFPDRSHLATEEAGIKAVFDSVEQHPGYSRPDVGQLWRNVLRKKFGAAGEDALRMNGCDPLR
ncbi:MAG: hypothetical protein ACAI25_07445 [Planctomycetota bacterium]